MKTKTESMVKSKYHVKELKTIEETEKRLYLQIKERMIADTDINQDPFKKRREEEAAKKSVEPPPIGPKRRATAQEIKDAAGDD